MRDFFKTVLATFVGLLLFTSLGMGALVALLVTIASSTRDTGPRVLPSSVLTFDLSQDITDTPPSTDPSILVQSALTGGGSSKAIALRQVLNAIDRATKDDRITGLYLHGDINSAGGGSGFATLREVRQALQTFRDSGKPIYAYGDTSWQERDYYLASVANTVYLDPNAQLEINGFSMETMFLGGAFQKYGIGMQALRAGKYKSAVEPFTRTSSSPESREESQRLLNDLWNDFLTVTAKSRRLTVQKLQSIANTQGLVLPNQAKADGLVDQVAYEDDVMQQVAGIAGPGENQQSFRQIDLSDYAEAAEQDAARTSDHQIAVIYAEGEIVSGMGGPGSIGGESLVRVLRQARQDDRIKAVVLRVNSPGGSATASAQVAREVLLTTKVKPVITSMGSYAASGGYEISTYANQIFASPTTITGSIGVFGLLPNVQKIANANGITWDQVKTGKLADSDTISRPKTPAELAIGQKVVDRIYEQFLTAVSDSRKLPKAKVAELAQGRVWSGVAAQKVGLVDQLGGLNAAIQAAATAAKLGEDWQVQEYPRPDSFGRRIGKWLSHYRMTSSSWSDPLSLELQKLQQDLSILRLMNDPVNVYSRLPFNPRID